MNTPHPKLLRAAHVFLVPWALVSAFAYHVWFCRVYDRGFKYKPYVLEFEFQTSRILLVAFGVAGFLLYEYLRRDLPTRSRVLFLILITAAIALPVVDWLVARFIPPFF